MKIGIYDPYLDDLGGGEKYMMTIASCLSNDNVVDIFWNNEKDLKAIRNRFDIDTSKFRLVPNIFTQNTSILKKMIISRSYDVIIILSDGSIPLLFCRKLLIHIQQPLDQMENTNVWGRVKLMRVYKLFCNSEYTKSFISRKFHLETSVVYPPIVIHAKEIKKDNIILHVGRFRVKNVKNDDYKKQGIMLRVFQKMVDNGFKDWELVLAVSVKEADKEQFKKMQESVRGYPIRFLINKTNEELWDIYSKAKIYWHASGFGEDLLRHPEYAEHFGISTVEAMGAGCVPVVINAGGQKEIVTDGENGYLWNTLDQLQERTKDLTKNSYLLEQLSLHARKRAQDFSERKFCQSVTKLLL